MQWTVQLEARTDQGEVNRTELLTFSRPAMAGTPAEVGLMLAEAKALMARLQASMLCGRVAEYAATCRVCPACGMLQPLKDRRTRRLQTLFGTVAVEAPRFRVCRCRVPGATPEVVFSPVCALLTAARCTPELERAQAELGARTSFREAARILGALLPVSAANHESVRMRTHAAAVQLEAADRQAVAEVVAAPDRPGKAATADASRRPVVMLDGAYVRAVPGHQTRNFEAICGKVEQAGCTSRRFALVRSVTERPHVLLRAALLEQGWREGDAVTVISDGDPALPALARAATRAPVEYILDWFHLSMRVRHVEQASLGLQALEPAHRGLLDRAQADVERLRSLLWNGRHEDACEALGRIVSRAAEHAIVANGSAVEAKARKLVTLSAVLLTYIRNNDGALIDYGARHEAGEPISTSRAEGTVNHLVSARMNKRQQMRWTPLGAHRVLQVRAAVLDKRCGFGQQPIQLAA
jgi:hypothetical protein